MLRLPTLALRGVIKPHSRLSVQHRFSVKLGLPGAHAHLSCALFSLSGAWEMPATSKNGVAENSTYVEVLGDFPRVSHGGR